jgi:hypothetical protein
MQQRTAQERRRSEPDWRASFPEWAATELDRLLRARSKATSDEERANCDLQLAVVCDAAERYGRSLVEAAEI